MQKSSTQSQPSKVPEQVQADKGKSEKPLSRKESKKQSKLGRKAQKKAAKKEKRANWSTGKKVRRFFLKQTSLVRLFLWTPAENTAYSDTIRCLQMRSTVISRLTDQIFSLQRRRRFTRAALIVRRKLRRIFWFLHITERMGSR